ncbi:MAG: hypothetical protein ACO1TE_11870 [Prosthecobacter sp.]
MNSEVYHTGTRHYRRLPLLIIGLGLVGFCGFFLLRLLPQWFAIWNDTRKFLFGLLPMGGLTFFTLTGVMLVRHYVADHQLELRIDSHGVSYGSRFYPWSEVGSLSGRWYHRRLMLLLHRKGLVALDRHLVTDVGLTEDEYDRLMERLNDDIGAIYPHLRLG